MADEIVCGSGMYVERGEVSADQARRNGVESEGKQFHEVMTAGRPMGRHGKEPAIFGSLRVAVNQNGLKTTLRVKG